MDQKASSPARAMNGSLSRDLPPRIGRASSRKETDPAIRARGRANLAVSAAGTKPSRVAGLIAGRRWMSTSDEERFSIRTVARDSGAGFALEPPAQAPADSDRHSTDVRRSEYMWSPRVGEARRRYRKRSGAWLAVLALALGATPGLAQDTAVTRRPGSDSVPRVAGDSLPRAGAEGRSAPQDSLRTDTLAADSIRADSVPVDSLGRDTLSGDSLPVRGAASPVAPSAAPPTPVDSALAVACEATSGEPPDLLTVAFSPSATERERAAVAREIGGTLLEVSEHAAPGAWYLRVPGSAVDPSIADRLILMPHVLAVGATRCPS